MHLGGFLLCEAILAVTVFEEFPEGGRLTLVVTGSAFPGDRHADIARRGLAPHP